MSTTGAARAYQSSTQGIVTRGTTIFAGSMLCLTGAFQVVAGIAGLAKDDIYLVGQEYSYQFDITTWGWIHLAMGVLALLIGVGVLSGNQWALSAGIGVGVVSALGNFAFMPYYPLWALTVIAFDAFVIWALCQQLAHAD